MQVKINLILLAHKRYSTKEELRMRLKDLPKIIKLLKAKGHAVEKQKFYCNSRPCYRIDGFLLTDYEVLEKYQYLTNGN